MFELILTDLKKRKQHKKLFQIAQNLIDSLDGDNKNDGGDKTFIGNTLNSSYILCTHFSEMFKHIIKLNKFIGDAFSMQNNFDEALKYYKKACILEEMLNSSGTFNSKETNAKTINHLGSRHFNQGNYDLAFEYFSKSLELTPSENKECLARVHNNIGLCLTEKQNFKEALNHFNDSLVLKKNAEFVRQDSIARTLGNMANCYQKLGENSSASMCHLACVQAKQQFKRQNSQRHQLTSLRVFDRSVSLPVVSKHDMIPARTCQNSRRHTSVRGTHNRHNNNLSINSLLSLNQFRNACVKGKVGKLEKYVRQAVFDVGSIQIDHENFGRMSPLFLAVAPLSRNQLDVSRAV